MTRKAEDKIDFNALAEWSRSAVLCPSTFQTEIGARLHRCCRLIGHEGPHGANEHTGYAPIRLYTVQWADRIDELEGASGHAAPLFATDKESGSTDSARSNAATSTEAVSGYPAGGPTPPPSVALLSSREEFEKVARDVVAVILTKPATEPR